MTHAEAFIQAQSHLPFWVVWGNFLGFAPIFLGFVGLTAKLMFAYNDRALHALQFAPWYERARAVYALRTAESVLLFLNLILAILVSQFFDNSLQRFGGFWFSCFLMICVWQGFGFWRNYRESKRLAAPPKPMAKHVLFFSTRLALFLLLALPLKILFSGKDLGWPYFISVLGVSIFLIWYFLFGFLAINKWCGLILTPSHALQNAVQRASAVIGRTPPRILVIDSVLANAYALPHTQTLVFTRALVEQFSDHDLYHIALHEIGHLAEKPKSYMTRLVPVLFVLPVLTFKWLQHSFGQNSGSVFLGYVLALFLIRRWSLKKSRHLEERADSTATAHEQNPGAYARALQKIYEFNLMPVTSSKMKSHPDLYDRLVASGVTPGFERPQPPSLKRYRKSLILFWVLPLVMLMVGFYTLPQVARVALTGRAQDIAEYGFEQYALKNWDEAARFLSAAAYASDTADVFSPEYAAYAFLELNACPQAEKMFAVLEARYKNQTDTEDDDFLAYKSEFEALQFEIKKRCRQSEDVNQNPSVSGGDVD